MSEHGARRVRWAAVAVLGLALAACSSNKGPVVAGSPSPSPTLSAVTPGGTTSPGAGKSPSPRPGSTRTAGGDGASPKASPTFGPSSAKLDKACVRRGVASDPQGITVKTDPGGPASYYTIYSDGSSIQNRPGLYSSGGQGGGFADANGSFRDTWVVPVAAPTGKATVRVVVAGRDKPIDLTFRVESQTGRCT